MAHAIVDGRAVWPVLVLQHRYDWEADRRTWRQMRPAELAAEMGMPDDRGSAIAAGRYFAIEAKRRGVIEPARVRTRVGTVLLVPPLLR